MPVQVALGAQAAQEAAWPKERMTENCQTFSINNCRVSHEIKAGVALRPVARPPKGFPTAFDKRKTGRKTRDMSERTITCATCKQQQPTHFIDGVCDECHTFKLYEKNPRGFTFEGKMDLWRRAKRLHASVGRDEQGRKWYLDAAGDAMPFGRCHDDEA